MSIRDERKQQSRQALLDAALRLSTSGRSFSSISLREVAREVGLVPTAFYRHFQDMDELGKELVDQVSLHLKNILHQLSRIHLKQPETSSQTSLELFFAAVDQNPEPWIFMIAERWGGAEVVRLAIAREIDYLNQDLAKDLEKLDSVQHFQNTNDLKVLSNILINLSFTWAMSWISLVQKTASLELELEKIVLKTQTVTQIQLVFRGISNWEKPKS